MKIYRLSPSGRRTTLVLLVGALIIWIFAIWTLQSTLASAVDQSFGIGQIVPALLMLALIIATPFVVWNLLEEWTAAYMPTDDGLRFMALGVDLTYPWAGMRGLRPVDDDSEEPMDELLLDANYTGAIRNPLIRFLHAQAYGRQKLPIYAGLEARDELLQNIRDRAGLAAEPLAQADLAEGQQ
jgi:hypothetical protein